MAIQNPDGSFINVVSTLDTLPGTDAKFSRFGGYLMNRSGQVAVSMLEPYAMILAGTAGSELDYLVRDHDPIPDRPREQFGVSAATQLNDAGDLAFYGSTLRGKKGLFLSRGFGPPKTVVLAGEPAVGPGLPANAVFSQVTDSTLNGAGQILFETQLTGTGITTANKFLWLWDPDPAKGLTLMLRAGEQIEVAPGDVRQVSSWKVWGFGSENAGTMTGFADSGALAMSIGFTNLSIGIFASVPTKPLGTEYHWVGNLSDNWHTVVGGNSNWKDEHENKWANPPGSGGNEKVIINNANVRLVDQSVAIGSLRATGSLTVRKALDIRGSGDSTIQSLSLGADLTVAKNLTISGTSECVRPDDPSGILTGFEIKGGTITVEGTLTLQPNSEVLMRQTGGAAPGTLTIVNAGMIDNRGVFHLVGASMQILRAGTFRNGHEFHCEGTIRLAGGQFHNDITGHLFFKRGSVMGSDGDADSVLRNRGEVQADTSGLLAVQRFKMEGGTLRVVSGNLLLHSYHHSGTGKFVVGSEATLSFSGNHSFAQAGPDEYLGVIEGTNAAESVKANSPAPLAIIRAMEVTQSVQDLENTVPLIAGKQTMVRCYLDAIGNKITGLGGLRLKGYSSSREFEPIAPISDPQKHLGLKDTIAERWDRDATVWFKLPEEWTSNRVDLTLSWESGVLFRQPSKIAGALRESHSVTVDFTPGVAPEVEFVRVQWVDPIRDVPFFTLHSEVEDLAIALEAMYPVSRLDYKIRSAPWIDAPRLDSLNLWILAKYVQEFFANRQRIWHGVYHTDPAIYPTVLNPPPTGYVAGLNTPHIASSSILYDQLPPFVHVHAHEIGHHVGLHHTVDKITFPKLTFADGSAAAMGWCGEFANWFNAPNFPHFFPIGGHASKKATLGPMGLGTEFQQMFAYRAHSDSIGEPETVVELMSYCGDQTWTSDFTYKELITKLQARFPAPPPRGPAMGLAAGPPLAYLSVVGMVNVAAQTAQIMPLSTFTAAEAVPLPAPGGYTLRFLSAAGVELLSVPFDPIMPTAETEAPPTIGSFVVIVPANPAIRRVQVVRGVALLSERVASANPPTIRVLSPAGAQILSGPEVAVEWAASDADGDPLLFDLHYSVDAGQTWKTVAADIRKNSIVLASSDLPTSASAILRVIASDGFHTASSDSDRLQVPDHAPIVQIRPNAPADFTLSTSEVFFEARVYDPDTGSVPRPDIEWRSSRDGLLGRGAQIHRHGAQLSAGVHSITATYIESGDARWVQSKGIVVVPFIPELRLLRAESGPALFWPAGLEGFILQSSPRIGPEAQWSPIPAVQITIVDEDRVHTLNISGQQLYYRLAQP